MNESGTSRPHLFFYTRTSPSLRLTTHSVAMATSPSIKKRRLSSNAEATNGTMSNVLQNSTGAATDSSPEALIHSDDPLHPANHICTLCRQFYTHGWVTGTGGGVSIRNDKHIFIAPSGQQKELMQPTDMFVMDWESKAYLRRPPVGLSLNVL